VTRVLACGDTFAAAIETLGLEPVDDRPELVLVDVDDDAALARAAVVPAEVPRIAIVGPERDLILRAIGSAVPVALSSHPAAIGPLLARLAPTRARPATRVVVVTGVAGGIGRTLLTVNLAARIGLRASVLVLDATGSGAASWWLGLAPGSWSDLEGLVDELTVEHIAVVASERERVRLIGAHGAMPSTALLLATARACEGWTDLVLVDAPTLVDERARGLAQVADRLLVLVSDVAPHAAALDAVPVDERTWVIASRSRPERIAGRAVLRALPDDPSAVRAATRGPSVAGGLLGRAYDDLAELLALDLR
jgi:hypothetical protein